MAHDPEEGVTPTGMIRTGARPRRYAAGHQRVLDRLVESTPGDVSLYLYGSVATGTAVVPTSDIDLLTFGMTADVAAGLGRQLSEEATSTCREVAIAPAYTDDLQRADDEGYGLRVFLRHYCVHLSGPALHEELPEAFPADRRAARGFNGDIAEAAARWRSALDDGTSDPSRLGTAVARKTLLAVAGLVSVRDGTWTTDRRGAAVRWRTEDASITQLLDWLDRPPTTHAEVRSALEGSVSHVVEAFADEIGLW